MADPSSTDAPRPRLALSVPCFAEPDVLVDLVVRAEQSGWDGVLLWDHAHGSPEMPVPTSDPWIVLGVAATRTERLILGTGVTAPARRRVQKLARETVTVDHLSGGRLVLGVGLGEPPEEHTAYGETADRRVLAEKLDESLDVLDQLWAGEVVDHHGPHLTVERAQLLPRPVQQPRISVWASCTTPHRRPLERAPRWDGVILANLGDGTSIEPLPDDELDAAVAFVVERRGSLADFDVAVAHPGVPDEGLRSHLAAKGATWVLVTGWLDELDALATEGPGEAQAFGR